ncbi:MAG TPA: hypothetical protein VFZ27_05595 [Terriglobia bacterium]|nr:hypothetical protein [Terriglobia bacterium]
MAANARGNHETICFSALRLASIRRSSHWTSPIPSSKPPALQDAQRGGTVKQTVRQLVLQLAWIASLVVFASAAVAPAEDSSARPLEGKDQPVIRVWIYDYARLSQSELDKTESQVGTLYAEAGVRIVWRDHFQKRPPVRFQAGTPSADFFVRILRVSIVTGRISGADALGQAIIPSGAEGPVPDGIANVFYDRVMAVSRTRGPCGGTFLGDAIAHELGHLLLGPHHSREGIMKAPWTSKDLELASLCKLRFTSEQLAVLQQAARSLPGNSLTMAVARR